MGAQWLLKIFEGRLTNLIATSVPPVVRSVHQQLSLPRLVLSVCLPRRSVKTCRLRPGRRLRLLCRPERRRLTHDLPFCAGDKTAHARGARLHLRRAEPEVHRVPDAQGGAVVVQALGAVPEGREAGAALSSG